MYSRFEKDCDVLVRWDIDTRMYHIYIRNTPDCKAYDCETIELYTSQGAIYFLKVLDKMGYQIPDYLYETLQEAYP